MRQGRAPKLVAQADSRRQARSAGRVAQEGSSRRQGRTGRIVAQAGSSRRQARAGCREDRLRRQAGSRRLAHRADRPAQAGSRSQTQARTGRRAGGHLMQWRLIRAGLPRGRHTHDRSAGWPSAVDPLRRHAQRAGRPTSLEGLPHHEFSSVKGSRRKPRRHASMGCKTCTEYKGRSCESGNPALAWPGCLIEECLSLVGESTPLTMLLPH